MRRQRSRLMCPILAFPAAQARPASLHWRIIDTLRRIAGRPIKESHPIAVAEKGCNIVLLNGVVCILPAE